MKIKKNKKGFTLVELVVVIAILAILAGTATVATIAILNNARKAPVTDAASSLKNQIQLYVIDGSFGDTKAEFQRYLTQSLPDLIVESSTGTNLKTPTNDDIHVQLSAAANLKTSSWSAIVFTQYFKVRVTCNYDTSNKGFTTFDISDAKKLNENF